MRQATGGPFKVRVTVEQEFAQPRLDIAKMKTSAATKVSGFHNLNALQELVVGSFRTNVLLFLTGGEALSVRVKASCTP